MLLLLPLYLLSHLLHLLVLLPQSIYLAEISWASTLLVSPLESKKEKSSLATIEKLAQIARENHPNPRKSPLFAVVLLLRPRGKGSSAIFHLKNNQKKHLHTRGCSTCILPEEKEEPFISSCLTLIPKFQQATFYSTIKSQSKLRELRETAPLPTKIYAEWKLFASKEKSDRRQRAAHHFRYKITHNSDTQKRTLEQNIRYSPKKGSHPSPQEN